MYMFPYFVVTVIQFTRRGDVALFLEFCGYNFQRYTPSDGQLTALLNSNLTEVRSPVVSLSDIVAGEVVIRLASPMADGNQSFMDASNRVFAQCQASKRSKVVRMPLEIFFCKLTFCTSIQRKPVVTSCPPRTTKLLFDSERT